MPVPPPKKGRSTRCLDGMVLSAAGEGSSRGSTSKMHSGEDLIAFQRLIERCLSEQVQLRHEVRALREEVTNKLETMQVHRNHSNVLGVPPLVGEMHSIENPSARTTNSNHVDCFIQGTHAGDCNNPTFNGQSEGSDASHQTPGRSSHRSSLRIRMEFATVQELSSATQVSEWAEPMHYELKCTAWDALVFVRIRILRPLDELAVVLVGLINFMFQLLFILIVGINMIDDSFTDSEIVKKIQDWRVLFAHDPRYANIFTDVPLAKAVCSRDPLIMAGYQQSVLFVALDDYLEKLGGVSSGLLMCMLATSLWIFTCARELHRCSNFTKGIWFRAYDSGQAELVGFRRLLSASSAVVYEQQPQAIHGDVKMKSLDLEVGLLRAITLTGFVAIPRLIILCALGFVGILFLVTTIDLSDLILNAVALEVILQVDEIMYELFAPENAKRVLEKTFPLRLHRASAIGETISPWLKLGALSGLLLIIRFVFLDSIIVTMIDSWKMMCDGDTDFVAFKIALGPVGAGKPSKEKQQINRSSHAYRAILQRTGLQVNAPNSSKLYIDAGSAVDIFPTQTVASAQFLQASSLGYFASVRGGQKPYGSFCTRDESWSLTDRVTHDAVWGAIRDGLGDHRADSCGYLKSNNWCSQAFLGGVVARFFCPVTCGCGNSTSGNVYRSRTHGVPIDCDRGIGPSLEDVPCSDRNVSNAASEFRTYILGFKSLARGLAWMRRAGTDADAFNAMMDDFARTGCPWLKSNASFWLLAPASGWKSYPAGALLCSPVTLSRAMEVHSIRFLCPVTCGCPSTVAQQYQRDGKNWTWTIGESTNCPRRCFVA